MQSKDLHSMTVVELRKLARESGVKLSAGIDKEGIVQRLSAALSSSSAPISAADETAPVAATTPERLQDAPLAADVTSVSPSSNYQPTWKSPDDSRTYRQAWQARTPVSSPRQPLRQPAWQQPQHAAGSPSRFGPQVNYSAANEPPAEERTRFAETPTRSEPVPKLDGYRLGYRAAPPRQDYGRQDYNGYGRQDYQRNAYRPAPRNDYQPRTPYANPYPPQGYAPRTQDAYYNDTLYKPVRDASFSESFERGQQPPELLQAGEPTDAEGILEILPDGYGFLRSDTLLPGKKDIYVSVATIRRYGLRTGDHVVGKARPQRDCDKFAALLYIDSLNGAEPVDNPDRLSFDSLVPIYPNRRIILESEENHTNWPIRLMDLIAPIGFGQRAMIVTPPESGKTILMREISAAIKKNDPDAHVMMLLIDERPEEVTEFRESVGEDAEVFASTFDEAPESQTRVSETMLERAERMVEEGKNVVVLLDSLSKLTRAYQATLTQGGRAMTNTVTPAALVRPKRFFGAARNTRDGGSLTVIATIMIETGSRIDDIIFEEFKGTANMELWLDTPDQNEPMFPVINLQKSGTKKEDILLNDQEKESLKAIRTVLGSTTNREALVQLIGMMEKTKCNGDLFSRLKDWVALWEKSGFLVKK